MPTQISNRLNFECAPRGKQRGATLIEAMVSLFVFAIGALGIAAMQTSSLVRVDDTKQRSLAIWKAQELADRMRNSKTINDPDGLLPEFLAAINNDNSDGGIGTFDSADVYPCVPADAPTRCDDISGTNANACTTDEFVAFEVWSVMCDPSSGVAVTQGFDEGSIGLRDVELAMEQNAGEFRLYIEWLSRSSNANTELQEEDADGAAPTVVTNLCGDDEDVDSRLDAYCVRLQ